MKILIADKFEEAGVDQLKVLADQVIVDPALKDDALGARLAEFDPNILIVRSTKVSDAVMKCGKNLRAVIRAGSGYDTIDIDAASERGITVSNCPGMNAAAVAELTIGLMIALDRKIPDNVIDLRAGRWKKKEYAKMALGFKGRTIGILGAGRVGSLVARTGIGMGMNVLYYHLGRQLRLIDYPNARRVELDDMLRESDVVTIHVPGGPMTHHLIDRPRIGMMKRTALLINTSRAGVIDEEALAEALREGRIRGAALDVYPNEPAADAPTFDSFLKDVPNLYGTHHVGASTEQAQMAVAQETVRLVSEYKRTGVMPNCVNRREPGQEQPLLVIRLKNQPGGLAHVFTALTEEGVNVEEMDHVVYDGGTAACAHIRIDKMPSRKTLDLIRGGHENVLAVDVIEVD